MTGTHHIEVKNRDAVFKFDLHRNITIIRGDSGTGKTTLYEMIADYTRLQQASGVNLSCDKKCVALTDSDWKNQLRQFSDSIVFIDEGADYLKSEEFAASIKATDNYYVLITRENLHELPYSVDEIYEIKTSGKQHSLKRIYKSNKKHFYYADAAPASMKYDTLLTEDSKSGFQFYKNYFKDSGIECFSSESNSAIFKWLKENGDKKVLVIADGAAFGAEIDRVLKLGSNSKFRLCLPESFEWLILKSGLVKDKDLKIILDDPSSFIECSEYFSWENFFEAYLVNITTNAPENAHFKYAKKVITKSYLIDSNSKKIIAEIL